MTLTIEELDRGYAVLNNTKVVHNPSLFERFLCQANVSGVVFY